MRKYTFCIVCICIATLLGACVAAPLPQQTAEPEASAVATETEPAPPASTPEPIPAFSVEIAQPLLYSIGVALSRVYEMDFIDFDAARGLDADRFFADALLYEFLNYELYDQSISPAFDEESFLCVMKAEDMLFLLHQYIGDYPALLQPPAGYFISQNEEGDYLYGYSDMGAIDYELTVEKVLYLGEGRFNVHTVLFRLDLDEDAAAPRTPVSSQTLRFVETDDAAHGYTIIAFAIDL